ncbi:hypothetical protein GIB67_013080 [Kingdonia uniflora]|uniref:Uncharacterized protein n=1 Tax=Kingdonia uniflora TaxID=39325 RepID=A0A7J7LXC4_9MAGN|nr:hypothetical protein GIB67_013080 [Kingdonia uniflora]
MATTGGRHVLLSPLVAILGAIRGKIAKIHDTRRSSACKMVRTLVQLMRTLDRMPEEVKSKSILDPCEDENDDIQEEEDVSLGVDSVQMADPSDSDSEIHSPEEDNYIITPTDNTQNDEEDEQQLARLRDWMELYHTDTVELTDVLSNFPDISMAILGGTFQVPTLTEDVVLKSIYSILVMDVSNKESGTEGSPLRSPNEVPIEWTREHGDEAGLSIPRDLAAKVKDDFLDIHWVPGDLKHEAIIVSRPRGDSDSF